MRHHFNLNIADLDRLAILIHGGYGVGKTHLQGSFLKWAKQSGEVRFLNIKGEDGYTSLAGMGLGDVGETVETLKDFDEAMAEYIKKGLFGLAIDSMSAFYKLLLKDKFGEVRYPDGTKDGDTRMIWGQLALKVWQRANDSRAASKYVFWVAPHAKGEDTTTGGKGTAPDLPGQLAWGSAGMVDLAGHLTAETLGPNNVRRRVTFETSPNIVTRQRLPQALTKPIDIPNGDGGWEAIYTAVAATFTQGVKK